MLVEKIIVVGLKPAVLDGRKEVYVKQEGRMWSAEVDYTPEQDGKASVAVVKNPKVGIAKVWSIEFENLGG